MKVELGEILDAERALNKVSTSTETSLTFRWRTTEFFEDISSHIQRFNELRTEIVRELGEEEEKSGRKVWRVKEENKQEYFEQLSPILREEVEIDHDPLDKEEVEKINSLNTEDIIRLKPFIE